MTKIFFTGDLHLGDENIRVYEKRPFKNIGEMDNAIVENWNSAVSEEDLTIVVGDVGVYSVEQMKSIIGQLKGDKILIKGNHDLFRSNEVWKEVGFKEVSDYFIIYNKWFIVQHEPPDYYNENTPFFWIYAHVHATEMYQTITRRSACVSTERWNFAPVELTKIIDLARCHEGKLQKF